MSLLTITAGRVLRISPPSAASNATHHTSPRCGWSTPLIGHVADQALAPVERLGLARFLRGHIGIAGLKPAGRDMRPREIVEEAADAARADAVTQAVVDIGIDRDCQFLLHVSLDTYSIGIAKVCNIQGP